MKVIPLIGQPGMVAIVLIVAGFNPYLRGSEIALPDGAVIEKVDFERHIMGILGRSGCASGSCHGSFQGKGGFRLSLFGYDPEKDFLSITHDFSGRRVNLEDPARSLLLLKATGQTNHEGLVRFRVDSWQSRVIQAWINSGARWEKGKGEVKSIRVDPPEIAFGGTNQSRQLQVKALFVDGQEENITTFCDFRSNDDAVVDVSSLGQIQSRRPGDTAIIVSYRGNVLPVRIMVPAQLPVGSVFPDLPESNYIDHEVFSKLRRLNMIPSDLSTDGEFLRRITLDTIGTLPTPEQVRAFLADNRPNKRSLKIDELLSDPMHAALWATRFCDFTGNNTDMLENPPQLRSKRSQMWYEWLRKRLQDNMPYDQIVKGILCSTSREGHSPEEWIKETRELENQAGKGFASTYADRNTLDLFWRRQQNVPPDQWGQKIASAFLGVRLECAECHKHPFDRWTQADYRSFGNLFSQVNYGVSSESRSVIEAENMERKKNAKQPNQVIPLKEVFLSPSNRGVLANPNGKGPLPARALGGPEIPLGTKIDTRVELFNWMRSPENPFFARSFVNRVWGHYFGVGIVNPVDDFSLANPPSNEKLLDALARDFVASNYDIRKLERRILESRTYQLSVVPNATNRFDKNNFSHSQVRPMMAEVVVDMINTATGTRENFGADAPPGCRAIEIGSSRLQNPTLGYAFRIFGRPARTSPCECERAMEPGLPQKLYLMADPVIQKKITDPNNRLKELLNRIPDDSAAFDELSLATLSRLPTSDEKAAFQTYRASKKNRLTAFADTLWALINTTEFVFNH